MLAHEHTPVLLAEVLARTEPQPGEHVIDCTLGAGGYAEAFLHATAPNGQLLGIDADSALIPRVRDRLAPFGSRVHYQHGSFATLARLAQGFPPPAVIVADLGLSSVALDDPERGFSFQADGPLDMRMDPTSGRTAADIVNQETASEIEHILHTYGEEPHARAIALAVVAARSRERIERTLQLAGIVDAVYRKILRAPAGRKLWLTRGVHPATKTFQALRIAVNDELTALSAMLPQAFDLLVPGGRLAIVSFHSLEDRIVKHSFQQLTKRCTCPPEQLTCTCARRARAEAVTRKPIQPSPEEIHSNHRSRSAKLRVLRKT